MVFNAGDFQLTSRTSPVLESVNAYTAAPPAPFVPPWQPAQLNPPLAVTS